MRRELVVWTVALLAAVSSAAPQPTNINETKAIPKGSVVISVDPSVEIGPIKPMNAVNNGPQPSRGDQKRSCWREFCALKVPYARSHDAALHSGYGGQHMGDITAIFPNFDADENDPASYDFTLTDKYVKDLASAGTKTFFRLGQSIEHWIKKYGVLPPKDNAKWARVCEHVIAHYTEGWADGFDAGIVYWEIWNEPDLDARNENWKKNPRTWGGSPEDFFAFYETAAKHLKARFPQLKIGGPAIAGGTGDKGWGEKFLAYMERHRVPIDFLSWHGYMTTPVAAVDRAKEWRRRLDAHGYTKAESIYNEWNYVEGWSDEYPRSVDRIRGLKGAVFTASVMAACQDAPVDMLMYYDLRPNTIFNGVFDFNSMNPLPGYWAFYAWRRLADAGTQVEAKLAGDTSGVRAIAARGKDGRARLLVANYTFDENFHASKTVAVAFPRPFVDGRVHLVDSRFTYAETEFPVRDGRLVLTLEPLSFAVVELP